MKKKEKTDQQKTEAMRKKCVAIAKILSKIRDGYKCCYCEIGKEQRRMHSHHIFHEGLHKSMSADVDNLITLCATHHQGGLWMKSHDGFNFHNSPRESTEWIMEKFPERYQKLKERSWKSQHCDIIFWTKKLADLKEELDLLTPQQ